MTVWTHALLDQLRQIGDPMLDDHPDGHGGWRDIHAAPADEPDRPGSTPESRLLTTWRRLPQGARPKVIPRGDTFWTYEGTKIEVSQLEIAHDLFGVYGGEIGATLLLASLPNAYAAEAGAAVLATTHELQSNARRRIGETAQFVVDVLFPDDQRLAAMPKPGLGATAVALPPDSRAFLRARTTRLTHSIIRSLIRKYAPWNPMEDAHVPTRRTMRRGLPINQEDLLGTLGTFTVTVFETMERLGIPWSDEAEQAFLDLWDRAGELLGVGTIGVTDKLKQLGTVVPPEYKGSLRPKTPTEARELLALIRLRNWPVPRPGDILGPFANAHGKVLVRALLDELHEAMPSGMERLPLVVMRYLVDPAAHELLGLGGGGLIDTLVQLPSSHQFARYPARQLSRGMVQRTMRLAANDISRRAFVHFINQRADDKTQTPFWFPGVPSKYATISTGRSGP